MMIMMGRETLHPNPTVQVPPWDDPTDQMFSPFSVTSPHGGNSVFFDELEMAAYDVVGEYDDVPLDAFSCDNFRMYEFKVRRCARGRSHDWTECPYAHPSEKARRRDPRRFHYSGNPCPELRKGTCNRGDTCEFAHGVFECWLHPSRYRTQPCKDGVQCRRRICFFAHTPEQLRVLPVGLNGSSQPESYEYSPGRFPTDSFIEKGSLGSSPTSTLYTSSCSPPMSPILSVDQSSVNELTSYVGNLQIGNGSRLSMSPINGSGFCSPRSLSTLRPGYTSLPSTPSRAIINAFDLWDQRCTNEGEPIMERVESGKDLRAKIYAKLSRENSLTARVET